MPGTPTLAILFWPPGTEATGQALAAAAAVLEPQRLRQEAYIGWNTGRVNGAAGNKPRCAYACLREVTRLLIPLIFQADCLPEKFFRKKLLAQLGASRLLIATVGC